jgi:hypothetical protein
MAIYFKCKSCQGEHRSPAGFVDRVTFDASPMPETQFTCHSSGATTSYSKKDMYWRAEP